ncbi:MAG: dTMP kinase [Pirellulaceae bacterium]
MADAPQAPPNLSTPTAPTYNDPDSHDFLAVGGPGMFFSFDGVDGAGKSTQTDLFAQWLRDEGHDLVFCRDPGSTPCGEAIRRLLLDHPEMNIHPRTEMLLYMAARAQLVEEVIRPAIEAGRTVLSDRYLLANLAYQGHAGGLDLESVRTVGQICTGGLMPDLTIVLDLSPEAAYARLGRELDRMEAKGLAFMRQVREGFLAEAEVLPNVLVVDATQSVDEIQATIRAAAASRIQELQAP